MAIIDADIKELPQCLSEKDAALNNLVSKALEISNSKRIILDKPRLETELLDIESQISKYEKSGISDTLKEKQLFDDQEKALLSYIDRKKNKIDEIKKYLDEVVIAYDDVTDSEIKSLLEEDLNGDSEYIISMDSETDIIQVNQTGTMDDESMRQEICDVMEGTKDAFEMRAKKYHFNIKE